MDRANIVFGPGSFSGNSAKAKAGANRIKIPADQYFTIANNAGALTTAATIFDDYDIEVDTPGNFSIGDTIVLLHPMTAYSAQVLGVAGSIVTTDELLNFAYPVGTAALSRSREMNVDGSTTPQKFELFVPPGTFFNKANVTRIMMECLTTSAVDLSKFGDIAGGLIKGLLLRGVPDPATGLPSQNNWNVKTNSELKLLAFDFEVSDAQNLQQGQHGFHWRYTYGGEGKHDAIPALENLDRLQIIIQDSLLTILILQTLAGGNFELVI